MVFERAIGGHASEFTMEDIGFCVAFYPNGYKVFSTLTAEENGFPGYRLLFEVAATPAAHSHNSTWSTQNKRAFYDYFLHMASCEGVTSLFTD